MTDFSYARRIELTDDRDRAYRRARECVYDVTPAGTAAAQLSDWQRHVLAKHTVADADLNAFLSQRSAAESLMLV